MKCVVIHNDTQEEGTEPLYSRSLREFNGFADCSAKPFLYYVYVQSLRQAQRLTYINRFDYPNTPNKKREPAYCGSPYQL